jgi:signal transduction histidine kinase/CheY-like chemotaxis protein
MRTSLTGKIWFRLPVIFGLSIIYAGLFFLTYPRIHNTIVIATFSLIFIIIIAWNWGKFAGIFMVLTDTFWTGFVLRSTHSTHDTPAIETFLGILIHFSIAFLTGTVGTLTRKLRHEISIRAEAENKLKEYQNHLEEMVQKRTQELNTVNEQLRHAEKMEAIGQLAGGIAHDFNNQLMIVMGYCELLMNSLDENSPQRNFVKPIQVSGKRASDLTRQLLAFARKGVYKSQIVNINDIAGEIVSLLARSVKNIQIVHNLCAEDPYVWGGSTQLQNALLNLALNARDAMENGGILTIETETVEMNKECDTINNHSLPPGTYVSVSVKDTGTGIDSTTLEHIFEPFFTTKEEGKGTGMGLAAVYGIVSSHKGGIQIETSLEKGTKFTLLFPVSKNEIQDSINDNFPAEKVDGKSHILVIDDEEDVAEIIEKMVVTIGYKVSKVFNGKEAVEFYEKKWKEIGVVIIDMVMPGMGGEEIYGMLKKINPNIKVIISSGYSMNHAINNVIKDGAKVFLQKPFNLDEIAKQIQVVLSEPHNVGSEDYLSFQNTV